MYLVAYQYVLRTYPTSFGVYPVFVTEVRAIYRRTLAKTALDAARMVGRLAACAGP